MKENPVQAQVLLAVGARPGIRLFRNSVGQAWLGRVIAQDRDTVMLAHPSRVTFGWGVGSSDLLGWRTIIITPAMVGRSIAQLLAFEVKGAGGRLTDQQRHFLEVVRAAGGLADVVRSGGEAIALVESGADSLGGHP